MRRVRCTLGVISHPNFQKYVLTCDLAWLGVGGRESHMQTLIIYKLGFNQNYYTLTLILLMKIVLRSKLPLLRRTSFISNIKVFPLQLSL